MLNLIVKNLKEEVEPMNESEFNTLNIKTTFDPNYNKFMQKFMHSFRNKDHPTININNLLILNGPEHVGKSWFLRHNLREFEISPGMIKNMTIHYDLRHIENQSFYSFLYNFERKIIEAIVERNEVEMKENNKPLINVETVLDVFFYRYEKGWTEINLAKGLKRACEDGAYTYNIDKQFHDELLNLIERYERKAFKEYIIIENIDKVVDSISKSMNITNLEAVHLLLQDCLIQREDLSKDHNIFDNELYRTGIETMEFFFDVLNHIAGYHEKQLKEEELENVEKKRKIYPHICLGLESVHNLLEMTGVEDRASNYLHRILLRCYVNYRLIRTTQDIEIIFL
jgi:hypothetical protein